MKSKARVALLKSGQFAGLRANDEFLFYAISGMAAAKRPKCISVRNASEPQMAHSAFPASTSESDIIDILKNMAGAVYGIYQYRTTISSAFACWGVVAGL